MVDRGGLAQKVRACPALGAGHETELDALVRWILPSPARAADDQLAMSVTREVWNPKSEFTEVNNPYCEEEVSS